MSQANCHYQLANVAWFTAMFKNMLHMEQKDCFLITAILQLQNPAHGQRSMYKFRSVYSVHVMSGLLNSDVSTVSTLCLDHYIQTCLQCPRDVWTTKFRRVYSVHVMPGPLNSDVSTVSL
jgi:hypothetical protein